MSVAIAHKLPGDPEFVTPQMRYSRRDSERLGSLEVASIASHIVRRGCILEKACGDAC